MKAINTVICLAFTALSACAVGPRYTTPKEALAPFSAAAPKAEHAAPPLDRWWTGFDDATLSSLIERALEQNLDLRAALSRADEARAVAQEEGAQRLPHAQFDAQVASERQSLSGPIGE